jgi:hypothetical protein
MWWYWFLTPLPIEVVSLFAFVWITRPPIGTFSWAHAVSRNEVLFPYLCFILHSDTILHLPGHYLQHILCLCFDFPV